MWNVVRFNWPKYIFGLCVVAASFLCAILFPSLGSVAYAIGLLALVAVLVPLVATHFIYDRSNLYGMPWLYLMGPAEPRHVLNLNAGFDESSVILRTRYPRSVLTVVDLFDATLCTEPSIARARRAYPPYPGTLALEDNELRSPQRSVDLAVAFLSLHEIRTHEDRVEILKYIGRALSDEGRLVVTEHVRDLANILAFSIGVMHFHSERSWAKAFQDADLRVVHSHRTAGFITTYILQAA
ncbi:MAG: hypothetical protein ACO1NQ_01915 [Flavobacteriales bacterium]